MNIIQISNIIAAYGTILLSTVLAYLYSQMWSTQEERTNIQENQEKLLEKQADIQEKQQNMLEVEKSAMLDISRCWSDGDRCFISVSNHGKGAIKQTMVRTLIQSPNGQSENEWKATQLKKYDDSMTGAKVIGANETDITMCCDLQFKLTLGKDDFVGNFSTISMKIQDLDEDEVKIKIEIQAIDEFDNILTNTIVDNNVTVHSNMEFEEIDAWKIN